MEMRTGMPCTSSTLLSNSTPIVMSCRGLKAPPPKLDLMELLPTPAHKSAETGQTGEITEMTTSLEKVGQATWGTRKSRHHRATHTTDTHGPRTNKAALDRNQGGMGLGVSRWNDNGDGK